jgi:hypothetical protein
MIRVAAEAPTATRSRASGSRRSKIKIVIWNGPWLLRAPPMTPTGWTTSSAGTPSRPMPCHPADRSEVTGRAAIEAANSAATKDPCAVAARALVTAAEYESSSRFPEVIELLLHPPEVALPSHVGWVERSEAGTYGEAGLIRRPGCGEVLGAHRNVPDSHLADG